MASELGISVTTDNKIVDFREKITKCKFFIDDNEFVKDTFTTIVEDRKKQEEVEEKRLQIEEKRAYEEKQLAQERAYEIEKLRLQVQNRDTVTATSTHSDPNQIRIHIKIVLPTFVPKKDDVSLFLTVFTRQMKLLNVPPPPFLGIPSD